jgi:hypothetical protein
MKVLSVISKMLWVCTILFILNSCSKPIEEKIEKAESEVEVKQAELVKAKKELKQVATDSVQQVKDYLIVSKKRLEINAKNIEEVKRDFISDKANLNLGLKEKVNALNQKNLELLSIINNSKAIRNDTWEDFRTELNLKMDSLEKSITDLKENRN